MNRLKALSGGQPLRSDDWTFIQDATISALKSIIEGLALSTDPIIIHGLGYTIDGDNLVVSDGVIFDGEEICFVPGATFEYVPGVIIDGGAGTGDPYQLFMIQNITTGEPRTFKDLTEKNVWEYRRYQLGYQASVPVSAISYQGLQRLQSILVNAAISQMEIPDEVLSYSRKSFNISQLDQYQDIIPAPGSGKFTQVIRMSARIVVTSQLDVGDQELYVFYGTHDDTPEIGSFPNSFLELPLSKNREMDAQPSELYDNMAVRVKLSGGTLPVSGYAQIIFYCIYKIITH